MVWRQSRPLLFPYKQYCNIFRNSETNQDIIKLSLHMYQVHVIKPDNLGCAVISDVIRLKNGSEFSIAVTLLIVEL